MDDIDELFRLRDLARHDSSSCSSTSETCAHISSYTDHAKGTVTCIECGLVLDAVLEDIFGNTMPLKCVKLVLLYRRKHHFNERLSQWLCLTCCVPNTVIDQVVAEVSPNTTLTKTILRGILRRLGHARYIENWIEIHCHITHRPYPVITNEQIEAIREMFIKIEIAFEKHRPQTRKCILSYNYVFARIFQIFGLQEHLMWVPPLKSRVKLKYLDSIWVEMTQTLGLPNIPPPIFNKSLR